MIRLGYPEIVVNNSTGERLVIAWFFGNQGERFHFSIYGDSVYKAIKEGKENDLTKGYSMENGVYRYLSYGDESKDFDYNLYKDYICRNQTFLVPINITSSYPEEDLKYLRTAKLPEDLIDYIHLGKATVLFFTHAEGNVDSSHISVLNSFIENNRLRREEVWLSSSDQNLVFSKFADRKFGYRTINYFFEEHWYGKSHCIGGGKREDYFYNLDRIRRFRDENYQIPKEKTILCLNRRPMEHRHVLFGYIMSDPEIFQKSYVSLGTSNVDGFGPDKPFTGADAARYIVTRIKGVTPEIGKALKYFKKHSSDCVLRQLDLEDLNMTANPIHLNESLYRKCFVNVITETYCDDRKYRFLTEKTSKTLYSMMPFILCSSQGTLKALKESGYWTFSNYWDESYDEIEDTAERLSRICKLVKKLTSCTKEFLHEMTKDMEPILYHNALNVIKREDLEETLDFFERIQDRRNINSDTFLEQ